MKKLIIISGPTGSGKTELAIRIALHLNTEIISADSRQVYKEIPIGTAQPSEQELLQVKHHLIGFLSVTEEYNAGKFEQDALRLLDNLFLCHDYVVVCGGTGLYINALINGFDEIPKINQSIRLELELQFKERGLSYLQNELILRDPEYAKVVDMANPQRLIRALEVCIGSGIPYSHFRIGKQISRGFDYIYYVLNPERENLYNRINNRVDKMFESGLLKEAERMFDFRNNNSLNTVGYSELFDFFDERISLENAKEKIKQHSRNYAKRQLTWIKKQRDIIYIPEYNSTEFIISDLQKKELQ